MIAKSYEPLASLQDTVRAWFSFAATGRKSVRVAYALWLGFGLFGLHRLYLRQPGAAAMMCAISLVSLALVQTGLGLLGFAATATWAMADLILIPIMTRDINGSLQSQPA